MATSLLVDTWADICLHPPAHTHTLFKGCLCNSRWLAYSSFRLTHVIWQQTMLLELTEQWQPEGRQEIFTALSYNLTTRANFWHVSISANGTSWQCTQNLRGPFLGEPYCQRKLQQALESTGTQKCSYIHQQGSTPKLYAWASAQEWSQMRSQKLCRLVKH